MRRVTLVLAAMTVLAGLVACAPGTTQQALPDGVEVHLDQSRLQRKTRTVFLRVHNGSNQTMRLRRLAVTSPRFGDVEWTGDEAVGPGYETDLTFDLPRGRCGGALEVTATLSYQQGDQAFRSVTHPADVYGAATALVDRDCAEETLRDAAALELGEITVDGSGRSSVLVLPITLTPTGRRDDVVLSGFGSTVLFALAPAADRAAEIPLTGAPVTIDLRLVPNRCDAHALADDKVGTLLPVHVRADDLPAEADGEFFLPIGARRRDALFAYYVQACGLDAP